MNIPLAELMRPSTLEEVVGQKHILGKGKLLNRIANTKYIPNMIFYGPPGVGKTTVANIIAKISDRKLYKLNATTDSLKDIKDIIGDLDTFLGYKGVVVYIDEIHHFPKRTQQVLLEYMENGKITLIGSTTENPYFHIFKAILSRATVVEFKLLTTEDIEEGLKTAINRIEKENKININIESDVLREIPKLSDGDFRRGLNILEILINSRDGDKITFRDLEEVAGEKVLNFDRDGDSHYDVLSAFQKSIRGSDPDGAVFYLAMLIKGGDLISICRRLLVIASEDIGLAHPQAITIVKACVDSARELGFPEARIPLAEATIFLATCPKSNSAYVAIDKAMRDLNSKNIGEIPTYLKDSHYNGAKSMGRGIEYKYPHNYENSYVKQYYLPENLKGCIYYNYGNNKMEKLSEAYWNNIKNK
ncbi:replication-associated recombination protein A [Clostridium sp.]|uniref:replication-associated recombination protein A n=1 Tax=Clostridium sp. TaxID=1506 RepID=UPI003464487A